MSLQGTLSQLGLAEVLQTVLAGRTGRLVLTHGVQRAVLGVDAEGVRLLEPEPVDPGKLLQALVRRGVLAAPQVEEARADAEHDGEVLAALVALGQLDGDDLEATIRHHVEDLVLGLLTWEQGTFHFEDSALDAAALPLTARPALDPSGLLLRATQRIDEQQAIQATLGHEPHLFLVIGEGAPPPDEEGIPATTVHAHLDGRHVVSEIALLCDIGTFAARRGVQACVEAGTARPATAGELGPQADARTDHGDLDVARQLLLQWADAAREDPEPLRRLAELGTMRHHHGEVRDALLALGQLLGAQGEDGEALRVYEDLLALRPGDPEVLEGVRAAARACGDAGRYREATIEAAAIALHDDEPERAAALLRPVVAEPDAPLPSRHLRARALVRAKDKEALLTDAQAFANRLGRRARAGEERQVCSYFADAVAHLAPERMDLVNRLRAAAGGRRSLVRRVATVAALLLALAGAGVALWPKGPSGLLADAREAAAAGRPAEAMEILAELIDEHPASLEASEAAVMIARLSAPQSAGSTQPARPSQRRGRPEVDAAREALTALPASDARAALDALVEALGTAELAPRRRGIFQDLDEEVRATVARLAHEVRLRADLLSRGERLLRQGQAATPRLAAWLEQAEAYRAGPWTEDVEATTRSLGALLALDPRDPTAPTLRTLEREQTGLRRAIAESGKTVDEVRLELMRRDIERLHEACRTDAAHHLVAGRLDEAEALYRELGERLAQVEGDPVLRPLLAWLEPRRIAEFATDRLRVLRDIRGGLAAARAAEEAGDVDTAVEAYVALVQRHWQVRFDDVIQLPLRVTSVPSDALVRLNGEAAGRTPLLVHRAWGATVTLAVEHAGYESAVVLLGETPREPRSRLAVALSPQVAWRTRVEPTLVARPTGAMGDVFVCDRTGRVARHAGKDGRPLWVRQVETLEGVRHALAVTGGYVYVPFVDGRVLLLDARNGQPVESLRVGRPVGDPGVHDADVALATLDGRLVVLRGRNRLREVGLQSVATTGAVSGHGAFWVGTGDGHVVRVDAEGRVARRRLSSRSAAVLGLHADADGVLASTADGGLYALRADLTPRWEALAVGDVIGAPARVRDIVAIIDHRGRMLVFSAANGTPGGQVDLDGRPRGGPIPIGDDLVTVLEDGRVHVWSAETGEVRADADLGGTVAFPPAHVGDGRVVLPVDGDAMGLIQVHALGDA